MIVVSDTSSISNLLTIRQARLLIELFREVIVPPAVEAELLRFHSDLPGFLKCGTPTDLVMLSRPMKDVDKGEAEAICLALGIEGGSTPD